jgi:AraC-like DNA-binding protein
VTTIVHRSEGVPETELAEYWRHVIGDHFIPFDPIGVPDQIRTGEVGAVTVAELTATGRGGAKRTTTHIRRSDPEMYKVDFVAEGQAVIEQNGRQAALVAGDFSLVDMSRPASWAMDGVRVVGVLFPRSMLPLRGNELDRVTAVRIPGDRGTGALVSSLARQLVRHLGDYGATDGARLGTAVLDLLTAGLATRLDRADHLPEGTRQRALLARIRAFIEARLPDPELSPGTIARAQYISVRYLHKLFEAEQATVAEWIRRRRLERCRRDLLDPALLAEPVGAIGMRWGFRDAGHFSRLFRTAYGMPPAEYRERAGARAAAGWGSGSGRGRSATFPSSRR